MSQSPRTITVTLMGKEYMLACPEEAEASLLEAARYLDTKMEEIRAGGRVIGSEKIAVMAALNIAYEMNSLRQNDADSTGQKLDALTDLIRQTLNNQPE